MSKIKLSLIGTFEAQLDGKPIKEFESSKVRALLAYLAIESGRPHSRDHLAGLFWGESSDEVAAKNLRQALSNLRKAIRDEDPTAPPLLVSPTAVQLDPGNDVWVDAIEFESLRKTNLEHSHRHADLCDACAARREKIISLYRGIFLQGYFLK
ncbi:MAG: winged helix-turn-helix domain-containing protein, partial [Anaerolineales bacterium]|nr:winged helix-turn-helix domain-containing protein [Anaerolineales bacterium]